MRIALFLPSFILATVLCYLPTYGATDTEHANSPFPSESQGHVVTISDQGLSPETLRIKRSDSMVFFLNASTDSLLTLELKFGAHATHCASANLKIQDNGDIKSIVPIAPKDFANSCFHDAGPYSYTIFGLKGAPDGVRGSILVE